MAKDKVRLITLLVSCLLRVGFFSLTLTSVCAEPSGSSQGQITTDESLIRVQAGNYAKAFAAGDARTIADMWTADAVFTDVDGVETRGRDNIEKAYAQFFADKGAQLLEITIESIKFPWSTVAIEQGVARLSQDASPEAARRYTAVHLKEGGRWRMCNVTESPYSPSTNSEYLQGLGWLIGDWTACSPKGKIHMNARWVADKHFMLCTYRADGADGEKIIDAQMIGWDPVEHRVFSSNFGSSGGFGHSNWSQQGPGWVACAQSVEPDGRRASALYSLRPVDHNTFTWQSTSRTLDGEPLPDTEAPKVVRDGSAQ